METLTWWERVQQAIQDGARMKVESEQGFPEQAASIAEVLNPIPTTPEDVALTLAGGPVAKGIGGAAAGVLKYLPWDKAGTRIAEFLPHQGNMKKAFERLVKKTEASGVEHGREGIVTTNGTYQTKNAVGDVDSLMPEYPPASYLSSQRNAPRYSMHTHPRAEAPYFSYTDLSYMNAHHGKGGMTPRNFENIVMPTRGEGEQAYSWLTLPRSVDQRLILGDRPSQDSYEAAQDTLARLIYGAKKDRWDLQLGFDPRQYGVSK